MASQPTRNVTVVTAFIALSANQTKHPYNLHLTSGVAADRYVAWCDEAGTCDAMRAARRDAGASETSVVQPCNLVELLDATALAIGVTPKALQVATERSVFPNHCPSSEIVLLWLAKLLLVQRELRDPAGPRTSDIAWVDAGFN